MRLNSTSMMKEMRKTFADIVDNAQQLTDELNKNPVTASAVYAKILQNIKTRYNILFGER